MASSTPPYNGPRGPSVGERAGVVIIVAAAFGVGMLVGGQTCAPEPELTEEERAEYASSNAERVCPEPRVIERTVEAPPKVIYECPPEPPPEPKRDAGKKTLPPPEPEVDPLERRRLLAWVRDQSSDLKACRDDSKSVYRLAVIMHLDTKTRRVKRVDINADRGDVPREVSGCIRARIVEWVPPKDLTAREKLVFGLNI